jgi:hypothetical protein
LFRWKSPDLVECDNQRGSSLKNSRDIVEGQVHIDPSCLQPSGQRLALAEIMKIIFVLLGRFHSTRFESVCCFVCVADGDVHVEFSCGVEN